MSLKRNTSINISFNCDPAKAKELIAAVNTVISKLKNETGQEVMQKVKETQKQERVKALKENDYWLDQ